MKIQKVLLSLAVVMAISIFSPLTTTCQPLSQFNNPKMERPQYIITVTQGDKELGKIRIETFPDRTPKTADNFDSLVSIGFYNGTKFHRVISGFMIQGGDPNSKNKPNEPNTWGMGDPSQTMIPAEFNVGVTGWTHKRGVLSMARGGDNNSATSQFFIVHQDSPFLDYQYAIFGQVLAGMDVVDAIAATPVVDQRTNRPVTDIVMTIEKVAKNEKK
jgi:peptidyl-prolyl cis-trans isomerase B (cyclophilin B)